MISPRTPVLRLNGAPADAHAEERLAQLDAQISRRQESVDLGIPTFRESVARTTAVATPPKPS
jgi:hypothetical protein